jgi:hypothetical protein
MQIKGGLGIALLTELTFQIGSMLSNNLKIIILKTFTNLEVGVEALLTHFLI